MKSLLSIDIGIKNLGYAVIIYDADGSVKDCIFDIYTIREGKQLVMDRIGSLVEFLDAIQPDAVIVEKQVANNLVAMCLMYSVVTYCRAHNIPVDLFDPKHKFTSLRVDYATKNKAHKRQSTTYAKRIITHMFPGSLDEFNGHQKKDDISDAIIQGLIWLSEHQLITLTTEMLREIV